MAKKTTAKGHKRTKSPSLAKTSQLGKIEEPRLLVELGFEKRTFKAADKHLISFALVNQTGEDVSVLKWNTPLEGVKNDMFHVECNGREAVYMGRLYKRASPTAADYVTVEAGGSLTAQLDLREQYDLAEQGNYRVTFRTEMLTVATGSSSTDTKSGVKKRARSKNAGSVPIVESNVALFQLEESRPARQMAGVSVSWLKQVGTLAKPAARLPPTFTSCSADRQTLLNSAHTEAVQLAANAKAALTNATPSQRQSGKRYREWFGAYDQTRFDTVIAHYDKIWDALANKSIEFLCDCNDDSYAYVYPTQPYKIYLCKLFWPAPLTGTDSKAGTLVHEMSHFNAVAGTDDHQYGQAACRTLANTNAAQAIDNADSHEYFAENTPPLTMDGATGTAFNVKPAWRDLPASFSGSFDTCLNGAGPFAGRCYFFKGAQYVAYDWATDKTLPGYPRNIAGNWPNLPAGFTSDYDAAINGQGPFAGKCYFFKGDSYVRYDWTADRADPGYPLKIADQWHGLPTNFRSNFGATINGNGPFAGKLYIFKGDSYVRYDWATDKTDPGYPKKIADNWHALPAGFTDNFEAALEGALQFANFGYFFKGSSYIRYNWQGDFAEA